MPQTERARSPERHSRHSRPRVKGSAPINIPARRKSSPGHSDMMFDMSPISPSTSPASSTCRSTSGSHPKGHETFMYQAPIFRLPPDGAAANQLRHKVSRQHEMLLADDINPVTDPVEGKNTRSGRGGLLHASESAHTAAAHQQHTRRAKAQSTLKITGFVPINEHQPPINEIPVRPTIPLHPPPRRLSPSRLPAGKAEHNVSYSQADPSLFEFRRHLLRRMDHQDPSRFKSAYAQCL